MFVVTSGHKRIRVRIEPGDVELRCVRCGRIVLDGSYIDAGEVRAVLDAHDCESLACSA